MIAGSDRRSFAARVLPLSGAILCLVTGCARSNGPRLRSNVPVNVFVIDPTIVDDGYAEVAVVFERKILATDDIWLHVSSEFFADSGTVNAANIWEVSPNVSEQMVNRTQWRRHVKVNKGVPNGVMLLKACTGPQLSACTTPYKYTATVINP